MESKHRRYFPPADVVNSDRWQESQIIEVKIQRLYKPYKLHAIG